MPQKQFWFIALIPLTAVVILLISSLDARPVEAGADDNITENIQKTSFLQTLENALVGTDIESVVGASGSYVMFAPTNSAFAALPAGVLDNLLLEPGRATLNYLLAYHVVESEALAATTSFGEVTTGINGTYATQNGVAVQVSANATLGQQSLSVNGVEVIGFIPSSNGAIWLVSSVIVPPGIDLLDPQLVVTLELTPTPASTTVAAGTQEAPIVPETTVTATPTTASREPTVTPTPVPTIAPSANDSDSIVDVIIAMDNLSTLESAVAQALLAEQLSFTGPFTVLAPTNEAFAALSLEQQAILASDPATILQYHVIPGELTSANLVSSMTVPTLLGSAVQVEISDGSVVLNGEATILQADLQASNGIVHVIDRVLFPPSSPIPQPIPDVSVSAAGTNLNIGRETFNRSEEIIVGVPNFEFPAGTNGSFRMQILQYPNGLEFAPVNYKDAQHWYSSGDIFVFGSLSTAQLNVPSVFVITPFTYEVVTNENGTTEYVYNKIERAPVSTSVNFSFVP